MTAAVEYPPLSDYGSWWQGWNPIVVAWLTDLHDCLQCRRKFDDPWIIPTGKPWPESFTINPEILWHWQDTHGYPHEELLNLVASHIGFKSDVLY